MKKKTKLEWILLTLALVGGLSLWTGLPVQAGIPFGVVTNGPFNGPLNSIYDVSGTYLFQESVPVEEGMPLDVTFMIVLSQDARGKIQGSGSSMINFKQGGMDVGSIEAPQSSYKAKGEIKTSGDTTRVMLEVKAKGFGTILDANQNFTINSKLKTTINTVTNSMVGSSKGKAWASELGSSKFDNMTVYPISSPMDGSWNLDLNITPDGNKLKGTGAIRLSNGGTLPMRIVKGEYKEKNDEAQMKLKGFAALIGMEVFDSLGSGLKKLKFRNGGSEVRLYKGKVMGQKIEWELMAP